MDPRSGGSKGGGPKGGGSKGGGPKVGPEGWGPQVWEAKISLFFPSSATQFVLFFPLWGSSRGILVVFLKARTLKCTRLGSRAVV